MIARRSWLGLVVLVGMLTNCTHRLAHPGIAHRVVSLAPNATQILFALGAGSTVVGVSRFDDDPPEVTRLPRVGGVIDPSFEAIVALRPDAVVGAQGPVQRSVLDRLNSLGIDIVFPRVESVADIDAAIDVFARLVGATPRAAGVHAAIHTRIDAVHARVAGRAAPTVLAVLGQQPLSVAGPGSFVDELVTLAGGRNAVRTGPRWPQLSLESVLALAPEVVLDLTMMEGHSPLAELWSSYVSVPAVRDGRVVRIDNPVVLRPGPRVGEAVEIIARAIHPGIAP